MVILLGIRTKAFHEKEFPGETDPLGGDQGIIMAVVQRYMTVFGIPYWGTRKMVKAHSIGTNQSIPVLLWTGTMKEEADRMLSNTTGAWKNRIVGQTLLLALLGFIAWLILLGTTNTNTRKSQQQYVADPEPGDIVLATETTPGHLIAEKGQNNHLFVFKIEDIRGDSLIIRRSLQKEETMKQYEIKNKDKLIALFDGTDFSPEREVYSLTKYREGDERLRRITKEFKITDKSEEKRMQDSILSYTDIIKPIYIKRLKK